MDDHKNYGLSKQEQAMGVGDDHYTEVDFKNFKKIAGMHGYKTWEAMKGRCYTPSNPKYKYYGARGIKVCERWHNFLNFYGDMYPKPRGTSLDRIDNDGDYSKENCRWSTISEQNNNKRTTFLYEHDGELMTLTEWTNALGFNREALKYHVQRKDRPISAAIDALAN